MPFQESVHLPVSARDTGYRQGGIELWIWGNARKFVFVVNGDDVELWPRLEEQIDARDSQPPFRNQHFALAPKCEVPSCCLSRRVVRSRDYDGEEEE